MPQRTNFFWFFNLTLLPRLALNTWAQMILSLSPLWYKRPATVTRSTAFSLPLHLLQHIFLFFPTLIQLENNIYYHISHVIYHIISYTIYHISYHIILYIVYYESQVIFVQQTFPESDIWKLWGADIQPPTEQSIWARCGRVAYCL